MDPTRLLAQTVILTVCTVIVIGFLIAVAYGVAHLTVHFLEHIDHEIRRDQTSQSAAGQLSWRAGQLTANVSDVSPDSSSWAQLQLQLDDG